ncbi:UNVERIFIED_CONTAM: hypothetical protein GTU68_051494 [Idotea baltica]|nr:hypothetical protein [Idotea baltica]
MTNWFAGLTPAPSPSLTRPLVCWTSTWTCPPSIRNSTARSFGGCSSTASTFHSTACLGPTCWGRRRRIVPIGTNRRSKS